MNEMPDCHYRVSVKALVLDDQGNFMLCKDHSGKWELPGGGLDHGESFEQGLKREIKEEMGLQTEFIAENPCYSLTVYDHSTQEWICNILFATRLKNIEHYTPTDECLEYRFFDIQTAMKESLFENVEKFIEIYAA